VDGHLHIVLLADGNHCLQEILQVAEQVLMGDIPVLGKQALELRHAFRFPARHLKLPCPLLDLIREGLWVGDAVNDCLIIGQDCGAVGPRLGQISAGPVKNRHKVVADHLYTRLAQPPHRLPVVVDIRVPSGQAQLDVLMDIDALNDLHLQASGIDFLFEG